ncbi:exodeoxyribonuclease III [Roseomonas xinghualingensis]|uniref:exodeoxyribonuclease III n=1 Tax=Roseomonas xinghualingensis TaxID=2986475 RepID=UPI0021F17659|nr:exodeoxyribonuclease III [Roseomonas sp. SXEYE001]MCV4206437.1 exodeoxyribonuclease III [Roseomonas sp. SXEYE001]
MTSASPSIVQAAAPLRVATWNINSVRLRAPLLRHLVDELDPDVLCLQETKTPDEHFPHEAAEALGYTHRIIKGMKGYNGVAVLSRRPISLVEDGKDWCSKGDCRHLGVLVDVPGEPVEIHNFYVPAGGDVPDPEVNPKFAHKLDFVAEVTDWTAGRGPAKRSVLVGDLNIAPLEHDVWSHKQMVGVVSHTPVEVEAMERWIAAGEWHDALRHFVPPEQKLYTWWSYRAKDWRASDRGRRLDHVWVSQDLAGGLRRHAVLKDARDWVQTSDHVPVLMEIAV